MEDDSKIPFMFDFIIPLFFSGIACAIGYWYNLSALENTILTLLLGLITFCMLLALRFEKMKSEILYFANEGGHDRTIFRLLTHFSEALRRAEGLSRELIVEEVGKFETLIGNAAHGHIEVRDPARSAISYGRLFENAANGSVIKATTLLFPSDNFRPRILDANESFIRRNGSVKRIFMIPRDKTAAAGWQEYINQQRRIGCTVMVCFVEDTQPNLIKDIAVFERPRIATVAHSISGKDYATITLISDQGEVQTLEQEWDQLNSFAHTCTADDSLLQLLY